MVAEEALLALLRLLRQKGYDFTTPTPSTHQRFLRRRVGQGASSVRDIFGWNLPFTADTAGPVLCELLQAADALITRDGLLRSRYRVSSAWGNLFLHSAFPTDDRNAVFFGPDTYRFTGFVRRELAGTPARLVDMGAGSGAGGLCAAPLLPGTAILLMDSNPEALRLARINAQAAGIPAQLIEADTLDAVDGELDLVVANPPYMIDEAHRIYRDGGSMLGAQVSLGWAEQVARRLGPGGRLLLYTGSAIVEGRDALRARLEKIATGSRSTLRYDEIDPDIFGEELEHEAYWMVDRIAAVGAVIQKLPAIAAPGASTRSGSAE